jgi:hypothetical protein
MIFVLNRVNGTQPSAEFRFWIGLAEEWVTLQSQLSRAVGRLIVLRHARRCKGQTSVLRGYTIPRAIAGPISCKKSSVGPPVRLNRLMCTRHWKRPVRLPITLASRSRQSEITGAPVACAASRSHPAWSATHSSLCEKMKVRGKVVRETESEDVAKGEAYTMLICFSKTDIVYTSL